jgi:SAM-dependent methyltransferase
MTPVHSLVRTFLDDQLGHHAIDVETHPDDRSLRYLERLYGHRDAALVSYFREGLSVQKLLRQVLGWGLGERRREARILDFASGFGRTTRFLVAEHSPGLVWVSDILPEALAFQERRLGVATLPSAAAPEGLACDRGFDLITAISFFTHLPAATFRGWLERLIGLLDDGGTLLLSVHDQSVLLPGRAMGANGFYFEELSEIEELDRGQYGSTWVTEPFVSRTLVGIDSTLRWRRFARGLWSYQDLYLVSRARWDAPPELALEPHGRLEELAPPSSTGRPAELAGWAADHDGSPVERVTVAVNGVVVAEGDAGGRRDDVAEFLGVAEARVGWRLAVAGPGGRALEPEDIVLVKAQSRSGCEFVIHVGTVEGTVVHLRLQEAERRIRELEHQVRERDLRLGKELRTRGALWWGVRGRDAELRALKRTLDASRFWKLRQQWWSWKRRLGLR